MTSAGIDWQREKWQSGLGSKFIHQGEKNAVKYADEIIVLSKGVQDYFKETYGRETHFIPNGVNRPQIREANLITDRFGLKKDSYILFLGRLVPEKGIRYLVEAFKNVKTDKKLVIAGGSSDTDSFMAELKELAKGDDRILFTGFVQGAMLDELYSNAYIYTLPSDLEGMPLSLLEAMSYGNCCLVSDIPECAEVVEDKALIFKKSDVDDLREKLQNSALKKMKYISVRDERSAEIVKKITGIKPPIVLDPTWLWDFDNDENIIKPAEEDYILVYGQDFTSVFIENLRKYANESDKKIIALDCNEDHYDWCDKMIAQAELSPFQWIGYFKYAASVATSTFHGVTFSLIFNKKFAFCKTDFIMAKVDDFLKELKLFDLFDKNQDDVFGMLGHNFNYNYINKIIEKKRTASLDFLRKVSCD